MRTYSATMLMLLPLAFAEQTLAPRPRLRKGQAAASKTQKDGMAVVADVGGVVVDGDVSVGSRRRGGDEAVIAVPTVAGVVPVVGVADPIVVTDVEAAKDTTTYPGGQATHGGSHGSASWPGGSTGWANKRKDLDDNTEIEAPVVADAKAAKDTTAYPGGEATYGGSHGSASWPGGSTGWKNKDEDVEDNLGMEASVVAGAKAAKDITTYPGGATYGGGHGSASWPGGATGWANKGGEDMDNNTEIEGSVGEGGKDTTTYSGGQATYGGSHGSASWSGGSTAWANKGEDMDEDTQTEASVVAVDKDTTTSKKSGGSGDVKAADPAHA